MNKAKPVILAGIVLLIFIVVVSSAYIVREVEQVIITQFGKPVGEPITSPGIHFKIPFNLSGYSL
jgi:membrane protease subunit HflC